MPDSSFPLPSSLLHRRSLLAAALALPLLGHAQAWPARPIVMIVPQAPGGTNDIVGRLVSQKLAEVLGASVVVENRPGAGGNIGTQAVAKAPRDGHTLLMTISSSQAINPALYRKPGFDPVKDFRPIGLIGSVPNVLLAHPGFAAKSVPELISMARGRPDEFRYASAGNGTLNHLLGEMLNSMAGIQLQHVPYKGVAPALNDVLGGQVPLLFGSLPSTLPHIQAGRLRALAVSGAARSPLLPDVPTIGETVPGYNGTLWVGLLRLKACPRRCWRSCRTAWPARWRPVICAPGWKLRAWSWPGRRTGPCHPPRWRPCCARTSPSGRASSRRPAHRWIDARPQPCGSMASANSSLRKWMPSRAKARLR